MFCFLPEATAPFFCSDVRSLARWMVPRTKGTPWPGLGRAGHKCSPCTWLAADVLATCRAIKVDY